MPRPTMKADLLIVGDEQFIKLWKLIDAMDDKEQNSNFIFEDRDKNLRDILVHLHEWHNMMMGWYKVGVEEGGIPIVPREGYNWRTIPAMNQKIWEEWQGTPLEEAKKLLKKSHKKIAEQIEKHTNDELFSKNIYKWTKTSTLGSYFVSATSSHYEWAMKKIKKHIKLWRVAALD